MELEDLLFIDIQTVATVANFEQLDLPLQKAWEKKAFFIDQNLSVEEIFMEKAGIYAEFGKIISIGIGFFRKKNQYLELRIKALTKDNEEELLRDFLKIIQKFAENTRLVAHNGKEFDFPYLCRRLLIKGLPLPQILQMSGKRSWQVTHLDTLEMWRFGDHKNYTALKTLACVFGINIKNFSEASQVRHWYYQEQNLDKISAYCQEEVRLTAEVFLKIRQIHCQELAVILL